MAPLLVLAVTALALSVRPSAGQGAGVALVALGIVLVRGLRRRADGRGLLLALAVGACIAGYTIVEACSATDALGELSRQRFDAIVSDYQMPGMDGLDLLQHVRILYPHMLRVLLTARADVQLAVRCLNEGGVHRLFLKPWSTYDLRGVLRLALHLHRSAANDTRPVPPITCEDSEHTAADTAAIARALLAQLPRSDAS